MSKKRDKKQQRDGNLATALKAANVTPESYTEPKITIKAKAIATMAACELLEELHPQALLAHNVETRDELILRGFTPVSYAFQTPHDAGSIAMDAALGAAVSLLTEQVKQMAGTKYVAFAPTFMDGKETANVSHGGVQVGADVSWNRNSRAIEVTIAVNVLVQG